MPEIIQVPTAEIKFLIRRTRDQVEFAELKGAIKEAGVLQPLQVRDITSWKPAGRRRPDGGFYKWEALFGEGRVTASQELYVETKDKRWLTVPAIVVKVPQGEALIRHLSENTREPLPWPDVAELIRADFERNVSVEELAAAHHLSAQHVAKLLRILGKASPKVMEQVRLLTVAQAESLTSLSPDRQEIVVEALHETGLHGSQTPAVIRLVQEQVHQTGTLSKTVLVRSITRLKQTVMDQRKVLTLKRTHIAIGPQIYGEHLLKDKKLIGMLNERGIDWQPFIKAYRK